MTNLSGANLNNGAAAGPQGKGMDSPSTFPKYSAYKDSGVEWAGALPAEWQVLKLKRAARLQSGEFITSEAIEDNAQYPVYGGNGLRGYTVDYTHDGEFALIGRQGALCGNINYAEGKFWASEHAVVVYPEKGIVTRWLGELLRSMNLGQYSVSAAQPGLSVERIADLLIPMPSQAEQTQIARFLDHETARIDALIEEQQRLIELLKEKRQAVISHAVTKGLDPTVQMKDSSVKWLGEVSAHWEITQIKRRCDLITDGAHISPETENGVYRFVSTRDVSDEGIDFDGCLRTSAASYKYLVKTGCQPATGDVLFSKDGTIGRTIVVGENSPDFVVASSLIIIRPNRAKLLPTYLDFMCQSWVVSQQVDGFVKGAGLPRLSIQNLTKVVGVFPPLEEQALIADFLQLQCAAARQLSSEAWRTMELLKERRSALISAAVTGKIDVRAWQPPASVPTPKLVQGAV
ncbi:restriction endonuclease subunit S [Pseudomonas syringae]|uniref:restriction endonuclease subunit S n=1 Tax=Pseudomonas syringae TaxID=317 RepID=UPI00201C20E6|nr:restriction endonuclease subunit S [Pseudomonas syringae]MCL6309178.1 restriction endonuclease subunit S [Pseudomonas syringae]